MFVRSRPKKIQLVAFTLTVLLTGLFVAGCSKANSDSGHAEILGMLGQISMQLETTAAELEALRETVSQIETTVTVLGDNTIPCTLERLNAGKCGEYNQPFNLSVSLCSSRAAEAQVAADFQINNNNSISLGVGWPAGIDGSLSRTVEFPGIPGLGALGASIAAPGFVLYGAPFPNLQAGVGASGSLGLDACIEVPISLAEGSSTEIRALMEQWQAQGQVLQEKMVEMANSAMDMSLEKVNDSLAAMEVVQSKAESELADVNLTDPLKIFERGRAYGALIDVLPIGDKIQQVLDEPDLLSSALSQKIEDAGRLDRDTYCDYFQEDMSAPELLKNATENLCVPIKEGLQLPTLANNLRKLDKIPQKSEVKEVICSALNDKSDFCN